MITDQIVPYEVLIRYNEDGTPRGAHCQYRRIIEIDGERVKDEVLPAAPLELDDFPTSGLMSDTTREALAQVTALQSELVKVKAERDQQAADTDEMSTAVANLSAHNDQMAAEISQYRTEIAAKSLAISERDGQIAALKSMIAPVTAE